MGYTSDGVSDVQCNTWLSEEDDGIRSGDDTSGVEGGETPSSQPVP